MQNAPRRDCERLPSPHVVPRLYFNRPWHMLTASGAEGTLPAPFLLKNRFLSLSLFYVLKYS